MLNKLIFLVLAAFSLGSLGQIIRISGMNLYLFDLVVSGANLYLLLFFLKKKKFYINSPFIFFNLFLVFSFFVTFFITQGFDLYDRFYVFSFLIRFVFYFYFAYFVFNLIKYGFVSLIEIQNVLNLNFYLVIFLNIVQYFLIRDISFMESYGFDPHTQRLTGFFLDPNFIGFYLVIYLYLNEFYLKSKYFSYISIIMIFLTESRSAFFSLLLFLFLYLFYNYKKSLVLFIVALILVSFSNLITRIEHFSASNDSSSLRIESWQNALYIHDFSPYFGAGFNSYRNFLISLNIVGPKDYYLNSSNYSDSSLLSVLVFGGWFGFITFAVFLLSFLKNYLNLTLLSLVLFNSLIINSLFYPPLAILIFLVLNLNLIKKLN